MKPAAAPPRYTVTRIYSQIVACTVFKRTGKKLTVLPIEQGGTSHLRTANQCWGMFDTPQEAEHAAEKLRAKDQHYSALESEATKALYRIRDQRSAALTGTVKLVKAGLTPFKEPRA